MPKNVLFIDDDAGLRRLVSRALERQNIACVTAGDGESGLAALEQQEFDVIAIDQNMPGMTGLETLERIHQIAGHPPVIFVTGTQDSQTVIAALRAGAFDYVVKDAQGEFIPLLTAALQSAVGAMRLRREKEAAEAEMRAARDRFESLAAERAMLLKEVNHRVGNSLQLIASMLNLQGNSSPIQEVRDALGHATARVKAIAQVHRRLYTSDNVGSVAIDQYLTSLVEDLQHTTDIEGIADLAVEAEPVETTPDCAVAIGVIVNELVINAIKYAYPQGNGPIRIKLAASAPDSATISVEDDGVGFDGADSARSTGLGQRIVKAMVDKIGARMTHDQSHQGTRIEVVFPIAEAKRGSSAT
jgi:two-component sensor histidine kinase/CheY-like chemotaxis protein